MIQKTKVFEKELSWITDSNLRLAFEKIVESLPDYFFTTAASSSGKYHPSYALGDGGLVRHTKAAASILHAVLELEHMKNKFSEEEINLMIGGVIIHDGLKHGTNGSQYTVSEHPLLIAERVENDFYDCFTDIQRCFLKGILSAHMGEFNTDFKTKKEVLPKPKTEAEFFVHLADYLASRKYLTFEFEDYYKPESFTESVDERAVKEQIEKIILLCKDKISNGADRDTLYKVIADNNGGISNPLKINDIVTANKVLAAIEREVNV